MKIGNFEIATVSGGYFRLDGGTMFGVVPKGLWNRRFPSDENNLIAQDTNCLLAQRDGRSFLIDTGYGSKLSEKTRKIFRSQSGDPLVENLAQLGISPEEIDVVILSHLHFDHAGGATQNVEGQLRTTFPNAEYVAQQAEWETATADLPELRGAYPQENLFPLKASGQLRLIDGDVEIAPGIRSIVTGGHTAAHQVIIIEDDGHSAIYLGDICPTTRHLPMMWCMAYDVDLLQTRRIKEELLARAVDENMVAVFDHDPDQAAAFLARDEKGAISIRESITALTDT